MALRVGVEVPTYPKRGSKGVFTAQPSSSSAPQAPSCSVISFRSYRLSSCGIMAATIKPFSKEQFISKGLNSWLAPSTLTKVRRDTKRTLEVLRRGGQKAVITDFPRFARTELGVTTCSGLMLRTSDVTLRDDGDFAPIFLLPNYFVCEIPGGERVLVEFYRRQSQLEEEAGTGASVELTAPSIHRTITIRSAPGPVAAAPQAPGPRYLDLSPLSSAALSLCTIIVGDSTRTADQFLQQLRSASITTAELPSAPVRIDSQAGYPLFAFFPGTVECAGRVFYAVSDIAGSAPSFLSFFPGPEGKPFYELQQAVLVPVSFLEHFPFGQAAPSIQRLVRTHDAFSSAHVGLGREAAQPDPVLGPRKVVRVYFPSTAQFRIWARDFPSGVPVTVRLETGEQVSAQLTLRLPPGGFTLQAPAECVFSAPQSQLLLRLADSMDDVILSSLARARTDLHVNPADHKAEDAVFTDTDQAGNAIVGFSTDPGVSIFLARVHFRVFPEGVDVPASSFVVTPRLRAALNSMPRSAPGQFAFDANTFTAATFPAVDAVVAQ
ncbi:hypothetical protein KFL_003600160 [Klebsormidium nitens]|uniref:Uncharacterized protein n=1 Tax=Klebsormidium nitens TaxID=105231 RepID=A0A1Y1IFM0_KLENI|nr:hypothetical protein KFL_003600160 [Klebsormidium nitens]|eukprot:GAQ87556.1 hypothetical protein KFL_003600160 [Klebsormidium nitens]